MGRPPGRKNKTANEKSAPKKGRKSAANGQETEREAPSMQAASKPERGSNSISDGQIQEWLAEATEIETAMARVRQRMSTHKKNVENAGGDWKAIKSTLASTKLSQAEAVAKLESNVRYHRAINVRVSWDGDQATLTDVMEPTQPPPKKTEGSRDLAAARAHSDGYNSGLNGAVPHDNPFAHAPGGEQYVSWLDGRDEGQSDREKRRPDEAARVKGAQTADASFPDEGPAHVPPVAAEGIF